MHRRTLVKSAAALGLAGGLGSVAFNAFAAGKIKPGA
ncbi:nicotinamidase, partial [Mycobacterium tuberculosis]